LNRRTENQHEKLAKCLTEYLIPFIYPGLMLGNGNSFQKEELQQVEDLSY
jgi:hypothetical protein